MDIKDIEMVNQNVNRLKQLDKALEALNNEPPMITCGNTIIVIRKEAQLKLSNHLREDLLSMRQDVVTRLRSHGVKI